MQAGQAWHHRGMCPVQVQLHIARCCPQLEGSSCTNSQCLSCLQSHRRAGIPQLKYCIHDLSRMQPFYSLWFREAQWPLQEEELGERLGTQVDSSYQKQELACIHLIYCFLFCKYKLGNSCTDLKQTNCPY